MKTRTQAVLSPEQAAALQRALLADTLAATRDLAERRVLFVAEGLEHEFIQEIAREEEIELLPQIGEDLGARMRQALERMGVGEGSAACLIGTDSPHLPLGFIRGAFEALAAPGSRVVVGPAADAGYYLIGARGALPPIFEGVAWGTGKVLPETLNRLERGGHPYALLPFWYDIDLPQDLELLLAHLPALRRESPEVCARTESLLRAVFLPSLGR